jgi:hypothetical protein
MSIFRREKGPAGPLGAIYIRFYLNNAFTRPNEAGKTGAPDR